MDRPTKNQFRWTDQEIRSQLDRILEHPEFKATARVRDFLRFVVEQTLQGNARQLKGFTIAREVFGRDKNFDAAHDPVVRIQAGRLRRAIERYYLVAGSHDPIRIDIPKGGYVPVFSEHAGLESDELMQTGRGAAKRLESWPSVLIMPFRDMTGTEELSYLGPGLATDLGIELGHCSDLRVMLSGERLDRVTINSPPDFIICGNIRADGPEVKVVVQLVTGNGAEQLWTDTIKTSIDSGKLVAFQERAAATISAHIAGEHGIIFRTLSRRLPSKNDAKLSHYEAVLKGYAYHLSSKPDAYVSALEALRKAHEQRSDRGIVYSMLALLYFDNIVLEFLDPEQTPLDEAMRLAHKGVQLEPDNQFSHLVHAWGHMIANGRETALAEIDEALKLCPSSMLYTDAIGYLLVLLEQWEHGERLIRKSIRLNPFYRPFVRYGTWLNCFRQADYQGALDELEWLAGIGYFWDPLARAATYGQLGRHKECRTAVNELLQIKPDFSRRGSIMIRHYVKSPEIRERIAVGLAAGGLSLEPARDVTDSSKSVL